MNPQITTPNFTASDDFYEALIDAHRDFRTPHSHELNTRLLLLLLANHIDQQGPLCEALAAARDSVLKPT